MAVSGQSDIPCPRQDPKSDRRLRNPPGRFFGISARPRTSLQEVEVFHFLQRRLRLDETGGLEKSSCKDVFLQRRLPAKTYSCKDVLDWMRQEALRPWPGSLSFERLLSKSKYWHRDDVAGEILALKNVAGEATAPVSALSVCRNKWCQVSGHWTPTVSGWPVLAKHFHGSPR